MGTSVCEENELICNAEQCHCKTLLPLVEYKNLMRGHQGTAGNMGVYATAIPAGFLIDSRGPRPAVLIGSVALAAGYLPIHQGECLVPVNHIFANYLSVRLWSRINGSGSPMLLLLPHWFGKLHGFCSRHENM
jgi:hypothetical protein